jgi:hypothetical protein
MGLVVKPPMDPHPHAPSVAHLSPRDHIIVSRLPELHQRLRAPPAAAKVSLNFTEEGLFEALDLARK